MKKIAALMVPGLFAAVQALAGSTADSVMESFDGTGPFADRDGNIGVGFDLPDWFAPHFSVFVTGLASFTGDSLDMPATQLIYESSDAIRDFYRVSSQVSRDFRGPDVASSISIAANLENYVPGDERPFDFPATVGMFVDFTDGVNHRIQATYNDQGDIVLAFFSSGGFGGSDFATVTAPRTSFDNLAIELTIRPDARNGGTALAATFRFNETDETTLSLTGADVDVALRPSDLHEIELGYFQQAEVSLGAPDPMITGPSVDLAHLSVDYPACDAVALLATGGQLHTVHNVQLDGQPFAVILRDGSYLGLGAGLAFRDAATARRASQALEAALIDGPDGAFDTRPSATAGCESASACEILTPWAHSGIDNTVEADGVLNQGSVTDDFISVTLADNDDLAFNPTRVWAVWTPLPPNDCDRDGVPSNLDNCTLTANDQRDTDHDGIGNDCDPDIAPATNDCSVNFLDLNAMKSAFFSSPASGNWNPDADLNGDDSVNFADLNTMKTQFFAAPGPSGTKNFCEPCDLGANLGPTMFFLDAEFSDTVFQPFLDVGEPRLKTVFRSLAGTFAFKVTDETRSFECDTPPTPLGLGDVAAYTCAAADGSARIPIDIPEPGCYRIDTQQIDVAEIAVGLFDFND